MNKKQAIINYNEYMKETRMYAQAIATLSFDDSRSPAVRLPATVAVFMSLAMIMTTLALRCTMPT